MGKHELDAGVVKALAAKASCDERTILKAAKGEAVRGLAGSRARQVLREAGFELPAPTEPPAPDPSAK